MMDGVCFQFYDNDITSKNIAKEMPRKRDRTPPRELHSDPPLHYVSIHSIKDFKN